MKLKANNTNDVPLEEYHYKVKSSENLNKLDEMAPKHLVVLG